jgi:hypothetical protein
MRIASKGDQHGEAHITTDVINNEIPHIVHGAWSIELFPWGRIVRGRGQILTGVEVLKPCDIIGISI